MFDSLLSFWIYIRGSLWFIPGVMIGVSFALAFALVELDAWTGNKWVDQYPLLFGAGADGSRGMLTAVASSMLTVAALAFSLTINAITQAAAQYTPRIYRNFLSDRANQFVLGYFVAVFSYCLIVLRTIRGGDEFTFVPSIASFTGLALALGGVFVLIFFIHHIALSLQIDTIIREIVEETKSAIDDLFPEPLGHEADDDEQTDPVHDDADRQPWAPVPNDDYGYLRIISTDGLIGTAEKYRAMVRMEYGIGEFVGTKMPLVSVRPMEKGVKWTTDEWKGIASAVRENFTLGRYRTIEQDVGFGIRQLVDIALKALSPGINDTTTAITAINNLGELLGVLAARKFPARVRSGNGDHLVIVRAPDFAEYVARSFEQIRVNGRDRLEVLEEIASALKQAALQTRSESRRRSVLSQLLLVQKDGQAALKTEREKERLESFIDQIKLAATP